MERLVRLRTFASYAGVGIANTAIDFAVFAACLELGAAAGLANMAGFLAGAINSYACNTLFTFRDARVCSSAAHMRRMLAFAAVTAFGLAVSAAAFAATSALAPDYIAKMVATLAVLGSGYLLNRTLVFAPRGAGQR